MSKIVAISGSPHISGNVASAIDAVLSGATHAGAECARYDLCKLDIKNCTYGVPLPFMFSRYIKKTGKSLKAMGLISKANIIIHCCTTSDKVKNDKALQQKLYQQGVAMAKKVSQEEIVHG